MVAARAGTPGRSALSGGRVAAGSARTGVAKARANGTCRSADLLRPAVSGDEGYKKAEVTGGGVALTERPRTLESVRHPGLFRVARCSTPRPHRRAQLRLGLGDRAGSGAGRRGSESGVEYARSRRNLMSKFHLRAGFRAFALAALVIVTPFAQSTTPSGYLMPKVIADIMDAEPLPGVSVSPDRATSPLLIAAACRRWPRWPRQSSAWWFAHQPAVEWTASVEWGRITLKDVATRSGSWRFRHRSFSLGVRTTGRRSPSRITPTTAFAC